jgi:hypothetical protein
VFEFVAWLRLLHLQVDFVTTFTAERLLISGAGTTREFEDYYLFEIDGRQQVQRKSIGDVFSVC